MKRFSRRSFLRGAGGATMALPWLDIMAAAPAAAKVQAPPLRMAFYYVPIGVVRSAFFPDDAADEFLLTPTMAPLKDIKHKVSLITGLDRTFQVGTDVHAQCASCFLSSAAPHEVKGSAWPLKRTLDQVVADKTGLHTPFRSLELSCNSHKNNKESMYFDNISWYGTGHVAPSIKAPRTAYRRLFGTQGVQRSRNITDLVLEDARSMKRELGHEDGQKFAEYFDSVRTTEEQMDRLERMKRSMPKVQMAEPSADELPRGAYIRLMGDLMVLALQTNMTHVASLMVAPERWDTPFVFEGVFDKPKNHHSMSHKQKIHGAELEKIDHFYMQQFAYLLEKMDSIAEADGTTLLDNTIFTYGSGLADGSTHLYDRLPIIVAGSAGGKIKTNRHLKCAKGTPLANLWLSYAKIMGLERERFADSTEELKGLLV